MFCCGNCFSDRFLSSQIVTESPQKGDCSFCGCKFVDLAAPETLADIFQQVIDLYGVSEDDAAFSLVALLKKDWSLFDTLDDDKSFAILDAIYPGTDFKSKKYLPKMYPDSVRIINWNAFREELKHKNRYFPKQIPDLDHLENLLDFVILPTDEQPKLMYRARCNTENEAYSKEEMKKPPEKLVGGGRANPHGIPYLYAASDPETAIAEIRPHKSDWVSVAKIEVSGELNLLDLRSPRKTISPFALDEDDLSQLYMDIEYLCRLGEELEKPILPREANLEYLPTQYLSEFIKHSGFDGVVYKSSVGNGVNYAIFNDDQLEIVGVQLYDITDVSIEAEERVV
ncbi:MAG: RES family NAD+ phosphorylase [Deltaproteobacteria bacterium]|nr:RES family NAD+ phosphorylase [Deltaproteobacteria bacterium]